MTVRRHLIDFSFRGWLVLSLFLSTIGVIWVILLGARARSEPQRCPTGFVALDSRCCAPGQSIADGSCVGTPTSCPPPFTLSTVQSQSGCALPRERMLIQGGSVTLGPTDWDSADIVQRRILSVRAFMMDRSEVTAASFWDCIEAGLCRDRDLPPEPGQPVTQVSIEAAAEFCAYLGGRLPTTSEWIFAATGPEARRYPWGPHGLVCRRAAYGLVSGPCATGATQPELAGLRPDGATPEGLLDLAGNVAEWTDAGASAHRLAGGSFRSKSAGELKVWAQPQGRKGDDVGFRCAYDSLPLPDELVGADASQE